MTNIKVGPELEVGKRLYASDLKERTVVVIHPPGRPMYITMWVRNISSDGVVFYAAEANWMVMNRITEDGRIVDDQDREVEVFEYLGEI